MLELILFHFLVSGCDFESAYQKAMQDASSNSFGMNIDRYCAGASPEEVKQFKEHYDFSRNQSKKIKELGLKETPKDEKHLRNLLENRKVTDGKVVAQTDQGAYNKHKEMLSGRIEELQAEVEKLRAENAELKSQLKQQQGQTAAPSTP